VATTLDDAITLTLQRVRISTSVSAHQDQARKYLNMVGAEMWPLVPEWFLDRTTTFVTTKTFTISAASGDFTDGETITGGTSGKTATVSSFDYSGAPTLLYVYGESGAFTATETITGGTIGKTATYASSASTQVYTPVSGPVTNWWSATNVTQNMPIQMIGPDHYDAADPDRSLGFNAAGVLAAGLNATTGYPELEVWPATATTGDTIRIRYRIDIAAWTSANDATTMQVLGIPRILESVLIFDASRRYLEQNRQYEMAQLEERNADRALAALKLQGRKMQGNRRYLPKTYGSEPDEDEVLAYVGTSLAVAP